MRATLVLAMCSFSQPMLGVHSGPGPLLGTKEGEVSKTVFVFSQVQGVRQAQGPVRTALSGPVAATAWPRLHERGWLTCDTTPTPTGDYMPGKQLSYFLILQLGLHLAEAVCLLGLVAGDVGQELEQVVVASAVVVGSSPGTLQALGPRGTKPVRPLPQQSGASWKASPTPS